MANVKYSKKEKVAFNKAVEKSAKLIKTYDGLIPDEFDRQVLFNAIMKLRKKVI